VSGDVEDLEAADGTVHVALAAGQGRLTLGSAPVSSDAFTLSALPLQIGAGPVPSGQLALHGSNGWFVQVDRTVIGGAQLEAGRWKQWTPPCSQAGGPALLAAATGTELVAACDVGLWTGPSPQERLYRSTDGGATFAAGGSVPISSAEAIGAGAGVTLVGGELPGGGLGILRSTDGRTWTRAYGRGSGTAIADLGMTTATQGVAVLHRPDTLLMTRDGGVTWAAVSF
jgi:hypothetical protein